MKRELRLLTDVEWAVVLDRRAKEASLKPIFDMFRQADKARGARKLLPPPKGYAHRCRECGHGTNDDERLCLACRFL